MESTRPLAPSGCDEHHLTFTFEVIPMASKSTKSKSSRKPSFPLTHNPCGQWSKKHQKRVYYFGSWRADPDGTQALERFNREWPFIIEGRTPPPVDTGDGCTIALLCNSFLTSKTRKMESGELSGHTFGQYRTTTDRLVAFFGIYLTRHEIANPKKIVDLIAMAR